MAVNDVYAVQFFYHAYQRQFVTTLHFRETVEETAGNPAAQVNLAVNADIRPSFLDLLAANVILGCYKTRKIVGAPGPEWDSFLLDLNGTQAGQSLPGSSALRLNTGATVQGRPNRGAQIISGISEADVVNGVFTADLTTNRLGAYITALQGGLNTNPGGTGSWEFGYMSRAPVTAGDPLLTWPGQFVDPTVYYSTGIPVAIRSREGTHTARRLV